MSWSLLVTTIVAAVLFVLLAAVLFVFVLTSRECNRRLTNFEEDAKTFFAQRAVLQEITRLLQRQYVETLRGPVSPELRARHGDERLKLLDRVRKASLPDITLPSVPMM